jgi:D-glycero-D-manno-heptose 1,7-bisphosphate phosphatase
MPTKKTPALILDRDGILIRRPFLTWKKKQLFISPYIAPLIRKCNIEGIPVIVITNQPVVARGLISLEGVARLHDIINRRLARRGARVDKFYVCPHHPEATEKKWRLDCLCRKPGTKLFHEAGRDFNIDFKTSVMVGDMNQDILAGARMDMKTILVSTKNTHRKKGSYAKPTYTANSIKEVAKLVIPILLSQKFCGKPKGR